MTNANCSAIGLVLALKPLQMRFGIESLFVTTMQAVSGAGYPGVPSLDILGNVVPFIKNEEEKLQEEVGKMLGRYTGSAIEMLPANGSTAGTACCCCFHLYVETRLIAKAATQNEARLMHDLPLEDQLIQVVSYAGRGFSGAQLCN